jgi:formyl transferase-like protein
VPSDCWNHRLSDEPLTVAFLVGHSGRSTILSIEAVCRVRGVLPVGIVLDEELAPFTKRVANLRKNVRREGWSYLPARAIAALAEYADGQTRRAVIMESEVREVLHRAFPDRCFSLEELAERYSMPLLRAGNLNSPGAAAALGNLKPDLGIVLGTRILKESTFSVPRLGCINLHKGKVPEYRGMPPGFWELFDGASTAGITVHRVATQLMPGT